MEKNIIADLKKYLNKCVDQDGIIDGKRKFALQLGMIENDLFNDVDVTKSSIYNFSSYSEDVYLEELPLVDEENYLCSLEAVSL
jgi:hypothetical protein